MITLCPVCNRQFRIYASQLSAAKGTVQCGFCGEQFNALDRLYDRPQQIPAPAAEAGPGKAILEEPQFEIPESASSAKQSGSHTAPADKPKPEAHHAVDNEIAIDLLMTETRQGSRVATALWSLGGLLLLTAITVQLAWFNRDWLLDRYPEYLPQARQLCDHYKCELIRERELDAIVLVNRDVRDHPRYNNALLVNITIENRSPRTQPFPGIQFMLFDDAGVMTAYRRLLPAEYLEPGVTIDAGMRPRLPLHLVLEVAETAGSTVGFEFDFF